MSNTHGGHRSRLKQRFLEHGLDNFNDLNALELLLFYSIPRQDTNEIAHRLLDRFGSFAAVMEATMEELLEIPGIGENTATLLKLIPQIDRRYLMSKTEERPQIRSSAQAGKILIPRYRFAREEIVYLLCLDSRNMLISCEELGRGTLGEANVSVRSVVERALKRNAAAVILAHNHVDGFAIPSRADQYATRQIHDALKLVGIMLADHIVVAGDDFVSFADSGLMELARIC